MSLIEDMLKDIILPTGRSQLKDNHSLSVVIKKLDVKDEGFADIIMQISKSLSGMRKVWLKNDVRRVSVNPVVMLASKTDAISKVLIIMAFFPYGYRFKNYNDHRMSMDVS
ncbi:uncharacterized protein EV154DRAFT_476169 [Mucor mucedo]|uniref:uncharacterized protein n=1 Tax=Mucor mucedo TaxID=29922 RepID=UPI002220AECB|nr:uncharacterized protein EV154DRAFT_476169 [Mucor mucedo]KAI7896523.1 hypothetical protein EV154DRAFT_476169 [Mucor mucedo]